jgi:hypothetical protein
MTIDLLSPFIIDEIGELTGTIYKGKFSAKRFLSHNDHLTQDRLKRELLGGVNPEHAGPRAVSIAEVVSQCMVRLDPKELPSWWKDSANGLNLVDEKPLATVYEKVMEIETKSLEEVQKKAEDAKKQLFDLKTPDPV